MVQLPGWLRAFEIDRSVVRLRKTGATARLDLHLVHEVMVWSIFYLCIRVRAAWRRRRDTPFSIAFIPDQPGPWYLVRAACIWAGVAVVSDAARADHLFFFEDATWSEPQPGSGNRPCLNGECRDISKSHVAATFEAVFGYPLRLDSRTHVGPAVEKSEVNARHDGRVVICPCEPRDGYVYQKLVDTFDGAHLHDLRTPCVGGTPIVVWEKLRLPHRRFSPLNAKATARDPRMVFSATERARIKRFCAAIGLDWGGLDVLRDVHDGLIYIVDVNKTDAGPVIALSLREKLRSTGLLATALCALMARRSGVAEAEIPRPPPGRWVE